MGHAILLDVDGTLLDSNDAHASAWRDTLRAHGFDVPLERIRPLIGMGGEKLVERLTGLAPESAEGHAISSERKQRFKTWYLPHLTPFACTRALLERLRRDGYRLVAATSSRRDEVEPLLAQAHVLDLVDQQTTADDAEHSKPDPDIVCAALRKASVPPREAVMIGDTPYDVAAARSAGVPIIALRSGGWNDDALRGASAVYDDVADLLAHYETAPLP